MIIIVLGNTIKNHLLDNPKIVYKDNIARTSFVHLRYSIIRIIANYSTIIARHLDFLIM